MHKRAFQTLPSNRPLTVSMDPKLESTHRAQDRQEFDLEKNGRIADKESHEVELERMAAIAEKAAIAIMRKSMVHKARPAPSCHAMVVKPSIKDLTIARFVSNIFPRFRFTVFIFLSIRFFGPKHITHKHMQPCTNLFEHKQTHTPNLQVAEVVHLDPQSTDAIDGFAFSLSLSLSLCLLCLLCLLKRAYVCSELSPAGLPESDSISCTVLVFLIKHQDN